MSNQPQEQQAQPEQQQIQVNVDYLRTTKVHICMPCYGGMLTESTFMSFIKWANVARDLGIDWTVETMTNESLITRARNTLTAKFLGNTDSTHLMFIDADIGWEPWHLLVLLNADKDVIGGLYPMKSLPIKWCVNGFDGAKTEGDLQEVSKTGTGFFLVKREVFEKLKGHPAVKPFRNDIGLGNEIDKHMKTYFDTGVRENRYYSEDWAFCENWRDLGGDVWVDKRVLLRHSGHFVFDHQAQDKIYNDLREIVVANGLDQPVVQQAQQQAVPVVEVPAPVESKVIASSKQPIRKKSKKR